MPVTEPLVDGVVGHFSHGLIIDDPYVPQGAVYWINPNYIYISTPQREGEKMKNFIAKLGSRKFLLAVGAVITMVANKQYTEAAAVAAAYMAAEGYIDSKNV